MYDAWSQQTPILKRSVSYQSLLLVWHWLRPLGIYLHDLALMWNGIGPTFPVHVAVTSFFSSFDWVYLLQGCHGHGKGILKFSGVSGKIAKGHEQKVMSKKSCNLTNKCLILMNRRRYAAAFPTNMYVDIEVIEFCNAVMEKSWNFVIKISWQPCAECTCLASSESLK